MTAQTRKIIHIDMDCFYAAVEIRDNPQLKGKPVAIGGTRDQRGVLSTANYEARKYGVHSAMATAHAMRLCPNLVLLPVNISKYKTVALEIRELFYAYTDKVEPLSLDEAYLDVTQVTQENGSATQIARALRQAITQHHQLTASAGVAPNKFLAKVASDWNKPDGLFVIPPQKISSFILQLPVNKIPGVGKVTTQKMHELNIHTCADLQAWSIEQLTEHFGQFGKKLFDYCRGIDTREVENHRIRKSVSVEETFAKDLPGLTDCIALIPTLFQQLLHRLNPHQNRVIKNQFIKIKFNDFTRTTAEVITTTADLELFQQLCEMAYYRHQLPVRLLGLGVHFQDEQKENDNEQLILKM